jgi:hypothetical protein
VKSSEIAWNLRPAAKAHLDGQGKAEGEQKGSKNSHDQRLRLVSLKAMGQNHMFHPKRHPRKHPSAIHRNKEKQ